MAAKIASVSIREEQKAFLDANPLISLSDITQSAIDNIISYQKTMSKDKEELTRQLNFIKSKYDEAEEFIELNGLFEKYEGWKKTRGKDA